MERSLQTSPNKIELRLTNEYAKKLFRIKQNSFSWSKIRIECVCNCCLIYFMMMKWIIKSIKIIIFCPYFGNQNLIVSYKNTFDKNGLLFK